MNRFVHRIIMSVLLVAALVLIWNVLGSRWTLGTGHSPAPVHAG